MFLDECNFHMYMNFLLQNYVSASESSVILSLPYQPDFVNFLVNELSFLYDKGRVQYFSAEGN